MIFASMADISHMGNPDQERRSNVGPGNTDSGFLHSRRANVIPKAAYCLDHHFRPFTNRSTDQALWCPNCGRLKIQSDV